MIDDGTADARIAEPKLPLHEIGIGEVVRGSHQATHIDTRAATEKHPGRVDQGNLAIRSQAALNG